MQGATAVAVRKLREKVGFLIFSVLPIVLEIVMELPNTHANGYFFSILSLTCFFFPHYMASTEFGAYKIVLALKCVLD